MKKHITTKSNLNKTQASKGPEEQEDSSLTYRAIRRLAK